MIVVYLLMVNKNLKLKNKKFKAKKYQLLKEKLCIGNLSDSEKQQVNQKNRIIWKYL